MAGHDVLATEIGAALAIIGPLLVFLPLFFGRLRDASGGKGSYQQLRLRQREIWIVPALTALAAADATLGLLALWGIASAAEWTACLLLVLVWLLVMLSVYAVKAQP